MGIPNSLAIRAHSKTAVACPLPTAITSWVVQIEPQPMPTRIASAPASIKLRHWSWVTTFPAITSSSGHLSLIYLIVSSWNLLQPWAVSMTTKLTPVSRRRRIRSLSSSLVETAPPTWKGPVRWTLSLLLTTLETWAAWSSGLIALWITPTPPFSHIERAISHSVTVSIGEETNGKSTSIFFVSLVFKETSSLEKSTNPGMIIRSS